MFEREACRFCMHVPVFVMKNVVSKSIVVHILQDDNCSGDCCRKVSRRTCFLVREVSQPPARTLFGLIDM